MVVHMDLPDELTQHQLDKLHIGNLFLWTDAGLSSDGQQLSTPVPAGDIEVCNVDRLTVPTKYEIRRFYEDDRPSKLIKTVDSLEEARDWCNSGLTRGGHWFDGYIEVQS